MMEHADENERERILEAMTPPNRIDPETGLPFGWDEDDELALLDMALGGL